jgi:hypothetical protein
MIEIDPPVSMFDGTCMTLSMESSLLLLLLLLLLSVSEKLEPEKLAKSFGGLSVVVGIQRSVRMS